MKNRYTLQGYTDTPRGRTAPAVLRDGVPILRLHRTHAAQKRGNGYLYELTEREVLRYGRKIVKALNQ